MLTTLERGVKGGKWFSLIDKVWKMQNLRSAFKRVKANKGAAGIDKQSIKNYESNLEENLQWLSKQLKEETCQSKPIRRCHIEKPGRNHETRPIGIATIEKLNPKLRGFYEYFKHGNKYGLIALDAWVRMRLRSILRKRVGRKGKGTGLDHHRYPNAYFANLGLFSLEEAKRLKQ